MPSPYRWQDPPPAAAAAMRARRIKRTNAALDREWAADPRRYDSDWRALRLEKAIGSGIRRGFDQLRSSAQFSPGPDTD